mgnify:FL=1
MNVITIPKKIARAGDLVVISRKEYESLRRFRRVGEFIPTVEQKNALARAEKNFKSKKTFSFDELISRMGARR